MAFHFDIKLCIFVACSACGLQYTAKARPVASDYSSLVARLRLDGQESPSCWDTLIQLQACTGEIVLFFLNEETHLGRGCCQAIRTIGEHCRPGMIDAPGFTAEEGHILERYCTKNATDSAPLPPSTPSVVVPNEVVPKQDSVP